jgi:hypothetical protein
MGKSESEYRSHYTRETRDPNSRILCPTLLAMECRYCFKKGHTVKYCPTIKKNEKDTKRMNTSRKVAPAPTTSAAPSKALRGGQFAQLDSDSEDEQEVQPVVEEFPALAPIKVQQQQQPQKINYASVLAADAPAKPLVIKPIMPPIISTSRPKLSAEVDWTAYSDDEDEDEDEDINLESDNDSYISRGEAWSMADKYHSEDDW